MEEAEPPECPVCLQPYAAVTVIPRVLPCGHTTCESCLNLLSHPFPNTIRCTVCTQLLKLPNSLSSLPKNLDLLYFSSILQGTRPVEDKGVIPSPSPPQFGGGELGSYPFLLKPWTYEFYCEWRRWILPADCVFCNDGGVLEGKVLRPFKSDRVMGCVLREKECVGLIKVGVSVDDGVDSTMINPSHESRILTVLWGMKEDERGRLKVIFDAAFRVSNVGKAYGFWCNEEDKCVYIVCEKLASSSFIECILKNKKDEKEELSADETSFLGVAGMEICEILSRLHLEGLAVGYLSLSCLGFDDFGRACVDLSEVVNISWRVSAEVGKACKYMDFSLKDMLLDQNLVFLSPEVLLQLIVNEGFELDFLNEYKVGPASDVWSVASLLVWVITGISFMEEMESFLHSVISAVNDEKHCDYSALYKGWMEKISALLESRLGWESAALLDVLCQCLGLEPEHRPLVTELWKCLRGLVVKHQFDVALSSKQEQMNQDLGCYVILGNIFSMVGETKDGMKGEEVSDVIDGISQGRFNCLELQGHYGFITGLAIGGGFLFSSSFDKIVNVWSLQDFTFVHSFKGHDHKVTSVIFVDGEQPLCISGDDDGAICIWESKFPFSEVPLKKLHEDKDWRYSGIHAMANSGTEYLYTGSGDRLVKAWSLQDHTLVCAMSGHKSVVSSLVVSNSVLYSGSWDGSVRLWSIVDHSPLAVLGEDKIGKIVPVSSLSANNNLLFAGHDNGNITIWCNDVLLKSTQSHKDCVFSITTNGKRVISGGWDKKISVQEAYEAADGVDVVPLGTISCKYPITAVQCWHGKIIVGQADGIIKIYYGE